MSRSRERRPPMTSRPLGISDPAVILKEGWIVLGEGDKPGQALPTGFRIGPEEIIQTLSADGLRRVLFPLLDGPGPEDLLSAGVKIRNVKTVQAGVTKDHLEVRCELPRLNDLFDDVAGEMISSVVREGGQPATTCIEVLDRWRALLRSVKGERPGRNQVVGLLGEMFVLEQIVKLDPLRRVDMWVGREGQRHDFRRGTRAIEVKSSLATEGRMVTVHGADQLEAPRGGCLDLTWLRFEHVPGGELSISGMIARLNSLGVPSELIHSGLDEHGLPPGTWPEDQYELRELLGFNVDERFPRIDRHSFTAESMAAISGLRYNVDLDLTSGPVSEAGLEEIFSRMAGLD
jgi:hypothetical protein